MHFSLRKAFLSLLAILWNSAFKWIYLSFSPLLFIYLLFSAICKVSSVNHFALLHSFLLGMVFITASCTMSLTSIHSSAGTLSIRSNPLNLVIIFSVLIQVIPEWPIGFPFLLQFKSEFCNKEFMIWATWSSQSCFWWLYRAKRDKNDFLSDQCKEIEENNRIGKTRDLLKKIRDTKGMFHAKRGSIKEKNGMALTEA